MSSHYLPSSYPLPPITFAILPSYPHPHITVATLVPLSLLAGRIERDRVTGARTARRDRAGGGGVAGTDLVVEGET